MKSDHSIKNIALASIHRSAMDIHEWKKTYVDPKTFPQEIQVEAEELKIILSFFSDNDWTLITTKKIVGKVSGHLNVVNFDQVDDFILGDFKNTQIEKTIFRVTDIYGDRSDFVMETGKASMASIKAIQTISRLYRTSI